MSVSEKRMCTNKGLSLPRISMVSSVYVENSAKIASIFYTFTQKIVPRFLLSGFIKYKCCFEFALDQSTPLD